jgi:adenylosuccinate lyase
MPHKRNPIGSENVTGLARVMRGYMLTAYENVSLWHERDISHSSAERIIIPDATTLLNYMLNRFTKIIKELTVFPEMMQQNMGHSLGLVFSQQVMLALIDQGLTREEAYEVVQPLAMEAWSSQSPFLPLLLASAKVGELLSPEEIQACFDPKYHLKYVDVVFDRLGL